MYRLFKSELNIMNFIYDHICILYMTMSETEVTLEQFSAYTEICCWVDLRGIDFRGKKLKTGNYVSTTFGVKGQFQMNFRSAFCYFSRDI